MERLAICAIFKNEARYLLEWIAYHRPAGHARVSHGWNVRVIVEVV
jgi:hypothetical protein